MDDSWQKLSEILSPEHRNELAKLLLEALATDRWYFRIEIEVKDHIMHRINVTKGVHLRKPVSRTNVTSKLS
jgi:hypothetical protein